MLGVWLEEPGGPWTLREVADRKVLPGGVLVDVLAVRVPSYTRDVLTGELGYDLPTPLVPGPTCIGRVRDVADDVFGVAVGEVVLCNSLYSSGEVLGSPDEILIGWTGTGSDRSARMQQRWRHGSFAERACYPAACVTPLPGAEEWARPELLPFLASLAIADGGLRRGGLRGGQCVVVNGATGNLGGAGVLAALARGAARVVATGRRQEALAALRQLDPRVRVVPLSGDRLLDRDAIHAETDAGADLVLDVIAHTPTTDPTLACIDALRLRGTAVLVGGVRHEIALPYQRIQRQQLTITGSFMFDSTTALQVWQLVRAGALDLSPVRAHTFGLDEFDAAMDAAASLSGLDYAVLLPRP
ncbi:zinc-binding dehydrogenase [Amycolatopsis pigmentata]|uniref:Zinc-binding dehydrogenase n=1 Tax=Amycolatopsis pigmentata TaxID=450801 RepID=A0ABW5FS95_9PSEU